MSDNSFAGINFSDPNSKQIFKAHNDTMCDRYKPTTDNIFPIDIKISKKTEDSYVVSGVVSTNPLGKKLYVKYIAPNPPTYNSSFSGSGLPYENEEMAFDNTPNSGVVEVINGIFSFSLRYPNSYYTNMGTVYIHPHVKIQLVNDENKNIGQEKIISLGEGIPFRSLTWTSMRDWNTGPLFYENNDLPVRTQYQILLDSAYPSVNKMPKNFWGIMPPH